MAKSAWFWRSRVCGDFGCGSDFIVAQSQNEERVVAASMPRYTATIHAGFDRQSEHLFPSHPASARRSRH